MPSNFQNVPLCYICHVSVSETNCYVLLDGACRPKRSLIYTTSQPCFVMCLLSTTFFFIIKSNEYYNSFSIINNFEIQKIDVPFQLQLHGLDLPCSFLEDEFVAPLACINYSSFLDIKAQCLHSFQKYHPFNCLLIAMIGQG